MKTRCPWISNSSNKTYIQYHDKEWGRPVKSDRKLFELLTLEGAQAGLSWETVLMKRANYRKHFYGFDPKKVSKIKKAQIEKILKDPGVIRNRLKIESTVTNAKAFLEVQKEFGSFHKYLWSFTKGKQIINKPRKLSDYPAKTVLSDQISKDLKKRGFRFVGSTIIYAYLQAVGVVDDHAANCFVKTKTNVN